MNTKKPDLVDIHVGVRIRMRRLLLGMSQTALADRLGITFQQVQKYEKGTNRVGASRLLAIAGALEVEPSFFFADQPVSGASADRCNGAQDVSDEVKHLLTRDGVALNRAFQRIADPAVRKRVIALVRALAEMEENVACSAAADGSRLGGGASIQEAKH